eukprot:234919-Hanusia_phi.AAC.1
MPSACTEPEPAGNGEEQPVVLQVRLPAGAADQHIGKHAYRNRMLKESVLGFTTADRLSIGLNPSSSPDSRIPAHRCIPPSAPSGIAAGAGVGQGSARGDVQQVLDAAKH